MILWIGNMGQVQLRQMVSSGELWTTSLTCLEPELTWDCGPECRPVVSPEWQCESHRTYYMAAQGSQEEKVSTFLRPRPWNWHSNTLSYSIGQSSPKACPDSWGGAKIPLLSGRYVKVLAAIFNLPQYLALDQYPINVYWMVHRFGSVLDPEKQHSGKRYWVEEEFKNDST